MRKEQKPEPKQPGHIETHKLADGTIAYRIVTPASKKDGVRNPRTSRVIGYSNRGFTMADALAVLAAEQKPTASYDDFYMKIWTPYMAEKGMSKARRKDYDWVFKLVHESGCFPKNVQCSDFTEARVRAFRLWYRAEYPNYMTRKKIRNANAPQLKMMVAKGLLTVNPWPAIPEPLNEHDDTAERVYHPDVKTMRAVVQAITVRYPQYLLMLLLAACLGLGPAELFALRRRWVNVGTTDRQEGEINLPPNSLFIRQNYYLKEFGRTKTLARRRILPIPKLLVLMFRKHLLGVDESPEALVFSYNDGTPYNGDAFLVPFEKTRDELGCPEMAPYACRRYFCGALDRACCPEEEARYLMGHSKAAHKMTERYRKADVQRRRKWVDKVARELLG